MYIIQRASRLQQRKHLYKHIRRQLRCWRCYQRSLELSRP